MINIINKIRIMRYYVSLKKEFKVFNFIGIRMFIIKIKLNFYIIIFVIFDVFV